MNSANKLPFLASDGQAAKLIADTDWSKTTLGCASRWPGPLKTTLGIMLGSRYPMVLWWGSDLVQFYNDAYVPTLGPQKHPHAMGQKGAECWSEAWALVGHQIELALSQGSATWHEDACVPIWRNGRLEEAYWNYCFSAVFDENGQPAGVINIVTETTASVQANRMLTKTSDDLLMARQELHSFLMEAPVGLALFKGPHHIYTLVNPVFCQMAFGGRPASHFLSKPVRDAAPELLEQGFYHIFDRVYQTGLPFHGTKIATTLRQADGKTKKLFVNFTAQARRDDRGRIIGVVAVLYEVTDAVNEHKEIERLADELRSAITARDLFLGVASHELNTPLTSLMLNTQMFSRRLSRGKNQAIASETVKKFSHDVFMQTKRLERLVSDMLDVSRLAAGKLTCVRKKVDLSSLVNDTLERFAPQLEAAGCLLDKELAPDVFCQLDAMRIEQVLSNIMVNAMKYAAGKPVTVRLIWQQPMARILVVDRGPGIAKEHQARIFARFERATSANEVSGLGLGLYISSQIIADHDGSISLSSQKGHGCTFTIDLPASCETKGGSLAHRTY